MLIYVQICALWPVQTTLGSLKGEAWLSRMKKKMSSAILRWMIYRKAGLETTWLKFKVPNKLPNNVIKFLLKFQFDFYSMMIVSDINLMSSFWKKNTLYYIRRCLMKSLGEPYDCNNCMCNAFDPIAIMLQFLMVYFASHCM